MPPKANPLSGLAGLFGPSPAFAAQAALLAALIALATALFVHDANVAGVSASSAVQVPAHSATAAAPKYAVTFMVPTVNSGQAARPSAPPMIAPPPPPRKHH